MDSNNMIKHMLASKERRNKNMSTYNNMTWEQKKEYQKYNSMVVVLKAISVLAVADEDIIKEVLNIDPSEVYHHLCGDVIGPSYLQAISNTDLPDANKTALQMSKIFQDIKMPVRKMLQYRDNDVTMVSRFRKFIKDHTS